MNSTIVYGPNFAVRDKISMGAGLSNDWEIIIGEEARLAKHAPFKSVTSHVGRSERDSI